MKRRLPIGISDFKKVIRGKYAYADKSLLIQEITENGAEVILVPRLRRFGKTLNLSMLQYFFEKREEDTSDLFRELEIWKHKEYRKMQGQFPVVFMTLKDIKFPSWKETSKALRNLVSQEFDRHRYLLEGPLLSDKEKADFLKIVSEEDESTLLEQSLLLLTKWLYQHHQKPVFLFIDEYDTPAHAAYVGGYYDTCIQFLRNWLSAGLKDNRYLKQGVLTGILRIAKESIFSGLNNIRTFSVLNESFSDKFGLLEEEVSSLLKEYDLLEHLPAIKKWYDGYQIGSCRGIYNPWSVLNCIAEKGALAPYWVNTSENALVKRLIAHGGEDLKADIEELMKGRAVQKTIEDGVVFPDLDTNPNTVWALLLFTGYVALDATPTYGVPCKLRIPNQEIAELYQSMVLSWFKTTLYETKYTTLLESLVTGDIDTFSQLFQEFMLSSTSVFDVTSDESEKIYHSFVLGILVGLKDRYEVKSNRESGLGRYDVMLIPKNPTELGLVLEFKKVGRLEKMTPKEAAQSALQQIKKRGYDHELQSRGISRIRHIGFGFLGKEVCILSHVP